MALPPSPRHDLGTVCRVLRLLSGERMDCWLFGGWAEELRRLCPARPHRDVDLLCVARSFDSLPGLLRESGLVEVHGKRFHHKRAFLFGTVMVELFLVETDALSRFTMFWGETRHDWPLDTFSYLSGIPVASASALNDYRRDHARLVCSRPKAAAQPA
jgi:hypothetical protein